MLCFVFSISQMLCSYFNISSFVVSYLIMSCLCLNFCSCLMFVRVKVGSFKYCLVSFYCYRYYLFLLGPKPNIKGKLKPKRQLPKTTCMEPCPHLHERSNFNPYAYTSLLLSLQHAYTSLFPSSPTAINHRPHLHRHPTLPWLPPITINALPKPKEKKENENKSFDRSIHYKKAFKRP